MTGDGDGGCFIKSLKSDFEKVLESTVTVRHPVTRAVPLRTLNHPVK
jgi:hypothetical protein